MSDRGSQPSTDGSPPAPESKPTGRLSAGYRKLLAASTISNLGDGIGSLAYPWLASAVTRNPLLIALVVVLQRLPWLVFSLPAGVVADRYDRARVMVLANVARAGLTLVVAATVLTRQDSLPGPDELQNEDAVIGTDVSLYLLLMVATLLLGIGEVLYDNAAQTFLPRLVPSDQLEKANGRLWSAEQIANAFVGPPLGAWLLLGVFALPFAVDAVTFTVSAALIASIAPAARRAGATDAEPDEAEPAPTTTWRSDIAEGFRWLWGHEFLRPLAIILGLLNMLFTLGAASLVLFAQEELGTSPAEFAVLTIGSAVGAVIGGWAAPAISKRLGSGPSLWATLWGGGLASIGIGLSGWWPLVSVLLGIAMLLAVLWNVITVSLRQTIIPDRLLGRVNSVYRFFAWGMMPIGALLGGLTMTIVEAVADRSLALRFPWLL
ncbi:MAG: MFS transporter, partial [Actinomycetota bacterium]